MRVTGIWDDAEDHRTFFEPAVKPSITDGVPLELQVIELRNTVGA